MASSDINHLVLTANLTADPDLRHTNGGTAVCRLRVASSSLRKQDGEWVERPNYFNVTVWGAPGEACGTHLHKGSQVAIDGRLEYRSWEHDGETRSAVEIVADTVKFLGRPREAEPVPAAVGADADAEDIAF